MTLWSYAPAGSELTTAHYNNSQGLNHGVHLWSIVMTIHA